MKTLITILIALMLCGNCWAEELPPKTEEMHTYKQYEIQTIDIDTVMNNERIDQIIDYLKEKEKKEKDRGSWGYLKVEDENGYYHFERVHE